MAAWRPHDRERTHPAILAKSGGIAEACRRSGMRQLAVFGSAARARDFDPARSDADLLVEFEPWIGADPYLGLKAALGQLLCRPVDLVDKGSLDESRNDLRKAAIRRDLEIVDGA